MRTATVTVAHGRHDHLRAQEHLLRKGLRVVVAMGDPHLREVSTADVVELPPAAQLPLARARNVGAERAWALGADAAVFLDVDVLLPPASFAAYQEALQRRPDAVLSGAVAYLPQDAGDDLGRWPPHPGRPAPARGELVACDRPELFWSLSFGVTRGVWERVGGFDETYAGYGAEDTDFALRCEAAGVPLLWVGGAVGHHQWHPPTHLDETQVPAMVRNGRHFAAAWGWWPMRPWFDDLCRRGLVRADGDGFTAVAAPARGPRPHS